MKNIFTDEVLINMSSRFLRVRHRYVMNKLKYYARNNDAVNFLNLANLFKQQVHVDDCLSLISNLLLYIVQHASCKFIEWFGLHQLQVTTLAEFYEKGAPHNKFRGIHPRIFLKALKYAIEKNWTDKATLLSQLLLKYSGIDDGSSRAEDVIKKIKLAIEHRTELNFEIFSYYLNNMYRRKPNTAAPFDVLNSLLQKLPVNAIPAKLFLTLPIEEQPWFHGNLSRSAIRNMFERPGTQTQNCFVVTFYGTTIYVNQHEMKKERIFDEEAKKSLPNYGLKRERGIIDHHLYKFYLALVANDFEQVKQIARDHELDWERTMRQPDPISEYLNKVDVVRDDIFEWLIQRFGPVFKVKLEWERKTISDSHLRAVERMMPHLLRVSGTLLVQYLAANPLSFTSEMNLLASCWDGTKTDEVWYSVLEEYPKICKQRKLIGQEKMMTLLAWRKAEGDCAGFRNLPKELIKIIVDYIGEPPLVYQLAIIMAKYSTPSSIYSSAITATWFERNHWAVFFYLNNVSKFTYSTTRKCQHMLDRVKSSFFKKHMTKFPTDYFNKRLWMVIFKYGTPTEEHALRSKTLAKELSLGALKCKNRRSLAFLIKQSAFVMPTREIFEASVKPKHNITYDEAVVLVKEVTQFVEATKDASE
jgi:hypothetical protein